MYPDNNNLNNINQINPVDRPALSNDIVEENIVPEQNQSNINFKLEPNKPKKSDYAIIYIIAAVVIVLVVLILVSLLNNISSSDSVDKESSAETENIDKEEEKEEPPKEEQEDKEEDSKTIIEEEEDQSNKPLKTITYHNPASINVTDKIAFIFKNYSGHGKDFLIGFSGKDIAKNLKGDSLYLKNEHIVIKDYIRNSKIEITYKQAPLKFQLYSEGYKKDKTGEYLSEQLILYRDKNFIIVKGNKIENQNHSPYNLYYYLGVDSYNSNQWNLILLSNGNSIEDLKTAINAMRRDFVFCTYDKSKDPTNCITESNQKINYNSFKSFDDVLIDSLIDYNLYIDNYEYIARFGSGTLEVEKYIPLPGAIGNDKVRYHITFPACDPITEKVKLITTLNGSNFKLTKPYNSYTGYLNTTNGCPKILIVLPSGVDVNTGNAMKVVRITFSKTKKD